MSPVEEKEAVVVPEHNPMVIDQHSLMAPKDGGTPLGISGVVNRTSGPKLINQVFINCLSGRANRKALVCLPVHVIPLERAMQKRSGGDVKPVPGMAPFIKQELGMTKLEVVKEIMRLHGNDDPEKGPVQQGAYVYHDDEGDPHNLFHEVYGGANGSPITIVDRMQDIEKAWRELVATTIDEMHTINEKDLQALIAVAAPSTASTLFDALEKATKSVEHVKKVEHKTNTDVTPGPIDNTFVEYMVNEHEINEEVARQFSAQISVPKGANDTLTDEQWKAIAGVGAHKQKRNKLMSCFDDFKKLEQKAG